MAVSGIRDVAWRAGVSVGTVSRVVNGHPAVRPALRSRVQAVIAELGYRPNPLARGLRRQRTQSLGLVVPDITNPFFSELALRVEQAAAGVEYSMVLGNSMDSAELEAAYVRMLAERQVDGLILVAAPGSLVADPGVAIPIIAVDREVPGCALVGTDHHSGAMQAVRHLVMLGHVRIACIAGPRGLSVAEQRLEGFATVVQEDLGIEVADSWVWSGSFSYHAGYQGALELLHRRPQPTALFASSDQQAVGALRACADLGLAVPRDVSVIGFDDIPLADLVTPRLTTIAQPLQEIGELAVRRLLEAIALRAGQPGRAAEPTRDLLPASLRLRDTTGPAPALRPLSRSGAAARGRAEPQTHPCQPRRDPVAARS